VAWTSPRTWVASEVVTKALLDTHLRDNLNALHEGALALSSQAAGDWVQASSASALVRMQPYSPLLVVNTTAVGNVGTGADDLMTYALAAGLVGTNGWGLEVVAAFALADNANNKQVKLYFGATAVITLTTSAWQNEALILRATIIRTGATAQVALGEHQIKATGGQKVEITTPAETLSGAITIKATGEATSNDDISQKLMIVRLVHTPT